MEDNKAGLKNRTPFQTNQRVSFLSPCVDTWAGPQYTYGPFDNSQLPANECGLAPDHEEVGDEAWHSWPEEKGKQPIRRKK